MRGGVWGFRIGEGDRYSELELEIMEASETTGVARTKIMRGIIGLSSTADELAMHILISSDAALKGTATKTGKAIFALARLRNLRLPVAASAAATAAAIAAATTAAVTTASTAASATAAAAASAATTTAAFALRAGFVYYDFAAFEIFSVQCGYGFIGFPVVADFNETETARLPRKTIADQRHRISLNSRLAEKGLDLFFIRLEREIAHVQFLHLSLLRPEGGMRG